MSYISTIGRQDAKGRAKMATAVSEKNGLTWDHWYENGFFPTLTMDGYCVSGDHVVRIDRTVVQYMSIKAKAEQFVQHLKYSASC
jgi:hypothetical protein